MSLPVDRPSGSTHSYTLAGWREWVSLPQNDVEWVKAKLDTGARSSAIHAFDLERFSNAGDDWARFRIYPWQKSDADSVLVELPIVDIRTVRSSNGQSEDRYVVDMDVRLHDHTLTAEMTLSRRDELGFRMLIGREFLRKGFVVDSSRSYLGGRPPRSVRRSNRGKPS